MDDQNYKILVIDDETEWQSKISGILKNIYPCEIKVIGTYNAADNFVTSQKLDVFDAIIVDIKLREQIYDQGGLAILNLIKATCKNIPVLILTAYSYDYPGLREIVERYPSVLAYDKEIFVRDARKIMEFLLTKLPPQIGYTKTVVRVRSDDSINGKKLKTTSSIILSNEFKAGIILIFVIFSVTVSFFSISTIFPEFSWQLNIVFAILVVTMLSILLSIFKIKIVKEAVKIYQGFLGKAKK